MSRYVLTAQAQHDPEQFVITWSRISDSLFILVRYGVLPLVAGQLVHIPFGRAMRSTRV